MSLPTAIALDGPFNGQYISGQQALNNGYEAVKWGNPPEHAYQHVGAKQAFDAEGVPVEFAELSSDE